MSSGKIRSILLDALLIVLLILFDQWTKAYIVSLLSKGSISLINGVLELLYLENKGAAFSMLMNHQLFFVIIASAAIILMLFILSKLPSVRYYRPIRICLVMIVAGAAGNLIDRIRFGYVRDFIYFSLIDFPVFNVADCYVTVSTFLLILLVLFHYKEDDFSFLIKKS